MLKLFTVLLGGRAKGCNTELHDTVFAIGTSLEEVYPVLVNKWFGNQKGLHIDSSVEVTHVDGHEVRVSKETKPNDKKLFFVNFGAYKPNYYGEVHEIGFYIGDTKQEIVQRAKKELCANLLQPHCDDNLIIDDVLLLEEVDEYSIHLIPTTTTKPLAFRSAYCRLDIPEIIEKAHALRPIT